MLPLDVSLAEVQTITATHTYVMGDNDSRNDARQLCFLEAKRKVLEKAGTFIQSHSVVNNLELTKDQITSYSAAVLSVETVKEEFGSNNGHNSISLTVKAEVDLDQVKKLMAAIVADRSLADRVKQQQQQILQLESQVYTLNSRLSVAPPNSAGELRKERSIVFDDISKLEHINLAAVERINEEQGSIRAKTRILIKYGVVGMTPLEVQQLVGEPFRKDALGNAWYYGDLYVCFHSPLAPNDKRVLAIGRPATKSPMFTRDYCLDSYENKPVELGK